MMIECDQLSKYYGRLHAVDQLSLKVGEHDVFALLGPNGSGKSTLIKMLTGLIWPSGGAARIRGHNVHEDHGRAMARVGAVIEWPAFIPYLSARKNLEIFTGRSDRAFRAKMLEIAEAVNMRPRLDDKVAKFSTGMKQRLGIALALLPDSEFIILDEPTNGLDPNGMIEIRTILKELNRNLGTTIFLTSHLLGEVEQVCNRIAIIHRGKIVAEGELQTLLKGKNLLRIVPEPLAPAYAIIQEIVQTKQLPLDKVYQSAGELVVQVNANCAAELNALLVSRQIKVHKLLYEQRRLEDYFWEITEGQTDVA